MESDINHDVIEAKCECLRIYKKIHVLKLRDHDSITNEIWCVGKKIFELQKKSSQSKKSQ